MKPTRSAKRTETSRRSTATAGAAAAVEASSRVPHSPQNFCPGAFAAPHAEQTAARAVPHSPQNFWPGAFSAPQWEQTVSSQLLHHADAIGVYGQLAIAETLVQAPRGIAGID